ncbi:DUF6504 family protein [Parvularcula dongshanensis]|uniref:DNA-directed DNA polymerase n=1 Tax=Parvularcula dongshanensis TaxID=1173995 RepID=A0A840I7L9_9PROT|nr:DUF6504 family protein [Parvularcula dongshanensis]MBB4660253.1 protein ImuB [Parvularcula dongshanensis]
MAVYLPRLPLDRLRRAGQPGADGLFAVTREERSAVRLAVLSDEALALGLTPGMTFADARALAADLLTVPEDQGRDAQLLASMQRYCGRYTPAAARDGADGLVLDVTGCAHLFGGEAVMIVQVAEDLAELGVSARLALADTRGAARAVARWGISAEAPSRSDADAHPSGRATAQTRIVPVGGVREAVGSLPVDAVAVPKDAVTMRRLGLTVIADLYRIPSAQLAKRFGLAFVEQLDAVLGRTPDPVTPEKALSSFSARLSLPDPIGLEADVAEGVRRLTAQVCKRLEEASHGARALRLEVSRADHTSEALTIGLAWPSRDPDLIGGQFRPRLAKLDARTGIDVLRLIATVTEPYTGKQHGFAAEAQTKGDMASLVASLGNRIGFDRVQSFVRGDSHLPERSFAMVAPHEAEAATSANAFAFDRPRPLQAVPLERAEVTEPGRPPRAFRWRGRSFRAQRAEGPERIAPEWWRDDPNWASGTRDYWRVQTEEGERLWLATLAASKTPDWYVAGVFA